MQCCGEAIIQSKIPKLFNNIQDLQREQKALSRVTNKLLVNQNQKELPTSDNFIDRLLILLRNSGVGCKIDNGYTGAISYADDITLSCPSIRGLNRMLDICNKFAAEHYLIFNSKKSLAIKYGKEVNDTEYVLLGQNRINWVDSVKHLGNYFNTQLSDSTDCMMKRSSFIGSVNKLMANFGHLQAPVLSKIFKTFCYNFYGSPIWDFNSTGFRKICTTWSIGVRTV